MRRAAIFGLLGAILGLLLRSRHTVPLAVLRNLRNSVVSFLAFNLIFGLTMPAIDLAAHLGGLFAGRILGTVMGLPSTQGLLTVRWRYTLAAVLGSGLLLAAARGLPGPPDDIQGTLSQAAKMEREVLARYNAIAKRIDDGTISPDEFVRAMEEDVVAPWREQTERLGSLKNVPAAQAPMVSKLGKYMKLRLESWEDLVAAVRDEDAAKAESSRRKAEEAERLIKEAQ